MANVFSETAKNEALDGITVDRMLLHSADPGAAGTSNVVNQTDGETPMTMQAVTFSAASSAERALSEDKEFTGLEVGATVTWFSVWEASGSVYKGKAELTGDSLVNSEGKFIITSASKLTMSDPS